MLTLAAGAGVAVAAGVGRPGLADGPASPRVVPRSGGVAGAPTGVGGTTSAAAAAVVVRVRDLATGALDLFVGAQRVHVRDADLAARIAAAVTTAAPPAQ